MDGSVFAATINHVTKKDVEQSGRGPHHTGARRVVRGASALPAICGVVIALAGCGTSTVVTTTTARASPAATASTTTAARTQAPQSTSLSPDQLAGQRVIYAYSGLQPPAALFAVIRAGEAGGVIFFGPNISSLNQIRGVISQLQQASLTSPTHTRLLMLVDQEGGAVRRLPGPPILSQKAIGESQNALTLARSAGRGAGQNLAAAGVNVNLAPVLDVYRKPGNFIDQFGRSYSANPSTVAVLGTAFIRAQQPTGVAATAKHFPGLGAATKSQNTDLGPVTLNVPLAILRQVDELPFRGAIQAGVKLVMTSWALYPRLDPHLPAGLSSAIINGELRQRLGFRGVTITDGINAGAVTPYGDLAKRSVLAANAGADLILCATTNPNDNTPQLGIQVLNALASAIAHHQISRTTAQNAADRILALRAHP
jgi:beta-N-acetylhexosaminidase